MKYRLKKDTPFYEKGTEFCEDWFHKGVLLNDDCNVVANLNELDNPDEWFEEVEEPGWWKPKKDDAYWTVSADGGVMSVVWLEDRFDEGSQAIGNVFKTEKSAHAYVDYLKAIATVRQDEGVLTPEQGMKGSYVYCIYDNNEFGPVVHKYYAACTPVNTVLFDTKEHAQASLDEHPDEWKTIVNYDWSRE